MVEKSSILESILEIESGDGCPTLWIYFMPWNYALKMVEIANLKYILLQWKKYQKQKPNSALGALTDEIGSVRGKLWRCALGFSWTTSGCDTVLAYVSAIIIGGSPRPSWEHLA